MNKKDAIKLRVKIHETFRLWFIIKRRSNSEKYFMFRRISCLPDGLKDLVRNSGFSCFHFGDCETYIE